MCTEFENITNTNFSEDGDKDSKAVKAAKNKISNGIIAGKIKKPATCKKCGKNTKLEAHHNKGYDEKNQTSIIWLCPTCHVAAHKKLNACKKKSKDTINRIDVFNNINEYMIEPFMIDQETGFYSGVAVVTNTGIFNYRINGKTVRELRTPDEVGRSSSLDSLKMIPITNEHPKEFVTSENAQKLSIGMSGEIVNFDNTAVSVRLTITDKKAIEDIKAGKVALSCGYKATTVDNGGGFAFGNNRYDVEQTDIIYNHIALVGMGRAGDLARLKFDRDDVGINESTINSTDNIETNEKGAINMATELQTLRIDGVDYSVDKDVIKEVNRLNKDSVEKDTIIEALKKDKDVLQAKADTLDIKVKEAVEIMKADEGKFTNEDVKERIELFKIADSLKVEYTDNDNNGAIKKLIIKTKNDKINLDAKSDDYINAAFDILKEDIKNEPAKKNVQKAMFDNMPGDNASKKDTRTAREKFCADNQERAENYKGAVKNTGGNA